MNYLANAFSIQMISVPAEIEITEITQEEVKFDVSVMGRSCHWCNPCCRGSGKSYQFKTQLRG